MITSNSGGDIDSGLLTTELRGIAQRIEQTYPGTLYLEFRPKMSVAARLQLFQAATVAFFTAVREAVNPYPLEYIVARDLGKVACPLCIPRMQSNAPCRTLVPPPPPHTHTACWSQPTSHATART